MGQGALPMLGLFAGNYRLKVTTAQRFDFDAQAFAVVFERYVAVTRTFGLVLLIAFFTATKRFCMVAKDSFAFLYMFTFTEVAPTAFNERLFT
jgi:hypothetical protein